MYVCMQACMYVFMYVCMHACKCHECTYIYIYRSVHNRICMYKRCIQAAPAILRIFCAHAFPVAGLDIVPAVLLCATWFPQDLIQESHWAMEQLSFHHVGWSFHQIILKNNSNQIGPKKLTSFCNNYPCLLAAC